MTANRPEEDRDAQQNPGTREEDEQEPVVVRDKRRIDPETGTPRPSGKDDSEGARSGEVTDSMSGTLDDELAKVAAEADAVETAAEAAGAEAASSDAEAELRRQVDELTADVKRVQAEYANYRKRVERDRETVINNAKASVAESLLTVLDDLERAEAHGDLTGPFRAVSDKLTSALREAGLEGFGQEGEEFDPSVHEAVQHETSPEVSGPTVTTVLRRGYRFGDRVLRPAMVAVTDHEPAAEGDGDAVAADSQGETSEQG